MSWDYRVVHFRHEAQDVFEIREIHYGDNGEMQYYTERALAPWGETFAELQKELHLFLLALDLPVLELEDLERIRSDG